MSSSIPTSQGQAANQLGSQGFLKHTYPELSVARATLVFTFGALLHRQNITGPEDPLPPTVIVDQTPQQ